ncbi:MAG: saccharopine dehydrogenase NADP-binding domain-containing protein [Deltaproteobacteria bacterium]|nr:saccharopine dehydrogenase NADP-binding domain-containing protein [Deltaproteobacteria bacterium]
MKRVLVLGAGLVTRPHVRYLLNIPDFHVTVASRTVSKAKALVEGRANGTAVELDAEDQTRLRELIAGSDLAVSLLPYVYHPTVARHCIELKKTMVTTSYVSDAMQQLDGEARKAGVLILNEVGVDPGTDHMSAMKVIDRVRKDDGVVVGFRSYCGGLPAPEANTNPLGYKFSWSPRGVILAGKNPARWRENGKEMYVPGEELFDHHWMVQIEGFGELEGYPNRNSLPYAEIYGIPKAETIFRGTLRYVGWCESLSRIVKAGWLSEEPIDLSNFTFKELTAKLLGVPAEDVRKEAIRRLDMKEDSHAFKSFEWLGLFSDEPLPLTRGSALDVIVARMQDKMRYAEGERDMLIMQHEFTAEYPDHRAVITSSLIDYGIPHGDTSMSRTVGLPAAIAVRMILQDQVRLAGVHRPIIPELYEPILAELEELGIRFTERIETVTPAS